MKRSIQRARTVVIAGAVIASAAAGAALARPSGITPAQVKKIADAEVKRLAPNLSVKSAQSAVAANAPALYAQVTPSGGVTTNSRGVVQGNVTRTAKGFYCFSGLSATPKGGVVTLDTNNSGADIAQLGLGAITYAPYGSCPAGTQAHVVTFNPLKPFDFVDDSFFVVFWS